MKLGTALRLGRVSNLPTTWSNVAAGLALGGGTRDVTMAVGLCAAISSLYVGGMYLNDAFDREHDARERPERPIPSGEVSAALVFGLGFLMLAAGAGIVATLAYGLPQGRGAPPTLSALVLCAVIVLYDAWHKGNPWSPVVMACNRALVYVTAVLSVSSGLAGPPAWGTAILLCYLIGLSYVAKQENLRKLEGAWPLLFLAAPLAYVPAFSEPSALGFYALLALFVVYSLSFLWNPARRDIRRAVTQLIAGISLLDAMVVAASGAPLIAALACVACFGLTLFLQRFVPGT